MVRQFATASRNVLGSHKCEEQALAATSSLVLSLSGARRGEALRNSFHMAYTTSHQNAKL